MEKPETWASELQKNSQIFEAYCNSLTADDTSGWGERLKALESGGNMPSGLLITGREGTGKHNTAIHMIQILSLKDYRTIYVSGAEMNESAAFVKAGIGSVLDSFYDANTPLCLVIDNPEECSFITEIFNYLSRTAMEYSLKKGEYPPLFIIIISGSDIAIPSMLKSQLFSCVMSNPIKVERRMLFESLSRFLKIELLVYLTEGMTYGQLINIREGLNAEIDSKGSSFLSDEGLKNFVESQKASTGSGIKSLYSKLEEFIDKFPEMISKIRIGGGGNGSGGGNDPGGWKPDEPTTATPPGRGHYEKMPVRDLANEIFGEERTNALIQ